MTMAKVTIPAGTVVERVDPMHRIGSLIHIEPAHATHPWSSGVPSGTIPNLAGGVAGPVAGGNADHFIVTDNLSGNGGIIERTAKGGIHFIVSQTQDQAEQTWRLTTLQALRQYISASETRTHTTFLGAAIRVTRGGAGTHDQVIRLGQSSSATRAAIYVGGTTVYGAAAPNTYVLGNSSFQSPGAGTAFIAVNGATSFITDPFMHAGPLSSSHLHTAPSWILYEVYVEDCTVSGRTWQEARDEFAARTARKFATVWADDSWSDPLTTLP